MKKRILDVLETVDCSIQGANVMVRDLAIDSRRVRRGSLFFAYKGDRSDGRDFIADACAAGASAVCTDMSITSLPDPAVALVRVADVRRTLAQAACRFWDHPSRRLHLTAITGTNGKTTTAYYLQHILALSGLKTGLIGTICNMIDGRVLPAEFTTPEPHEFNRLLNLMTEAGITHAAAEVSSQGLDQGRTEGLHFSQCLFTNLSGEHLDYHETMDAYFQAKLHLFRQLPAANPGIVNIDDEYGAAIPREFSNCLGVSLERDCFLRGTLVKAAHDGTVLDLQFKGRRYRVHLNRPGRHNAMNYLLAAGAALAAACDRETVMAAAGSLPMVPGRLEEVTCGSRFRVYVDYAHTDNALENVLTALKAFTPGRIITVFGAGGDRDRTKRPRMGAVACRLADRVMVTSDNPRTEDPQAIIRDILEGTHGQEWKVVPDRREAIREALEEASAGDAVLIAGKGHEDYQIIGRTKHHFSDAEVVREYLCGKVLS